MTNYIIYIVVSIRSRVDVYNNERDWRIPVEDNAFNYDIF